MNKKIKINTESMTTTIDGTAYKLVKEKSRFDRWVPESRAKYYYVDVGSYGHYYASPDVNDGLNIDKKRIEAGNCFKTRDEANAYIPTERKHRAREVAQRKLIHIISIVRGDWRPDWSGFKVKCYVIFNHLKNSIYCDSVLNTQYFSDDFYFAQRHFEEIKQGIEEQFTPEDYEALGWYEPNNEGSQDDK